MNQHLKMAFLSFITIFIFAGCNNYHKEFNNALGNTLFIHKHNSKRKLTKAEFDVVKKWFNKNQDGWSSSLVTYAPRILLKNKNININVTNNLIIINMKKQNGDWIQIVKNVSKKSTIPLKI